MLLTIIIGSILGIFFGIISGLIPGLHINSIIYLITKLPINIEINSIIIIISSIIFCFLSILPSIILSLPNNDNFISILPAQKMYLRGKGFEAILLYLNGAKYSLLYGLPLLTLFLILLPHLSKILKIITPIILIISLIFLFLNTKNFLGYLIIIFAGLIGYLSMNYFILENPLLPLISGLFGISSLIFILKENITHIKQKISFPNISRNTKIKIGVLASSLSIIVSLFPGLGNGFATYFGSKISKLKDEEYILLNGGISTLVMILSFFVVYTLGKSRTASAVFFKNLAKNSFVYNYFIIVAIIIFSIFLGYYLTIFLSKRILLKTKKINNQKISYFLIVFLHILVLIFSGYLGLIVFWISGLIGYLCILSKNPRILMLTCIIIPVLIYFI